MSLNRRNSIRNSRRAPHLYMVLCMLLLAVDLCEDGEHAPNSLTVSMSMSISINIPNNKKKGAHQDF